MSDAWANRKSPVRMATELLHRELAEGQAAAHLGLVHHVVVEQGGQVGQLDGHRRVDDPGVPRVAELRGQQHQQGPEPLAARLDGVPGRLGEQLFAGVRRLQQRLLDPGQVAQDLRLQGGVREIYRNCCGHMLSSPSARTYASNFRVCPVSGCASKAVPLITRRGQLTNRWLAAWLARFSTGSGTMPKTRVAATPMPTAVPVNTVGTATTGPSGSGSLKNMSTMIRT